MQCGFNREQAKPAFCKKTTYGTAPKNEIMKQNMLRMQYAFTGR